MPEIQHMIDQPVFREFQITGNLLNRRSTVTGNKLYENYS